MAATARPCTTGHYPTHRCRNVRERNLAVLRECGDDVDALVDVLLDAIDTLPTTTRVIRIHDSGDFYRMAYLLAWMSAAQLRPNLFLYSYSKCVPFLVGAWSERPMNFRVVLSDGGKYDDMIPSWMPRSQVFEDQRALVAAKADGWVDGSGALADVPAILGCPKIGLVYRGNQRRFRG